MAHIVELREMSTEQLRERLEDLREEMFNLRFQKASARLQDTTRIRVVRREIAQVKEVLHKRDLAVATAAQTPELAAALEGKAWNAQARYVYEDAAWIVDFFDADDSRIGSATVNLNKKRRQAHKGRKRQARLVNEIEVTGS